MGAAKQKLGDLKRLPGQEWQAEDDFAIFFARSLDLLCVAGWDGYFKRLNPAWTTRLGWTLEELKAKPFREFVHPDDREITVEEFESLIEGGETTLFENRYRHWDGSYRWLRWTARPEPGRERIYAIARDVTRQKWLEREIIEIADREKERLGRELHDGLCQNLAGISALSSTLSKRLATSAKSAASAAAAEITQLLNETITQARNLARGLGTVGLNRDGLGGALESLCLNVEHQFRVTCTLECDDPVPELREEVVTHLFRIAQEAVHNAIIHGKAPYIGIGLRCKNGAGRLSVQDDGVGLPEGVQNPEGIGLHTMAYRARLISGSLKLRRRNPRGTEVICDFPLPNTPDRDKRPDHGCDKT